MFNRKGILAVIIVLSLVGCTTIRGQMKKQGNAMIGMSISEMIPHHGGYTLTQSLGGGEEVYTAQAQIDEYMPAKLLGLGDYKKYWVTSKFHTRVLYVRDNRIVGYKFFYQQYDPQSNRFGRKLMEQGGEAWDKSSPKL